MRRKPVRRSVKHRLRSSIPPLCPAPGQFLANRFERGRPAKPRDQGDPFWRA